MLLYGKNKMHHHYHHLRRLKSQEAASNTYSGSDGISCPDEMISSSLRSRGEVRIRVSTLRNVCYIITAFTKTYLISCGLLIICYVRSTPYSVVYTLTAKARNSACQAPERLKPLLRTKIKIHTQARHSKVSFFQACIPPLHYDVFL